MGTFGAAIGPVWGANHVWLIFVLISCALEAPTLWTGLLNRGWPLIGVSIVSGTGSLFAIRSDQYRLANLLAVFRREPRRLRAWSIRFVS